MGDDAQLLQLARIARIMLCGLEVLVHTVDGDAVVREFLGDRGEHTRLVVDEETHGECGLGRIRRGKRQDVVRLDTGRGGAGHDVARGHHHVADNGGSGRRAACATAVQHDVVGFLSLDEHGVEAAMHGGERVVFIDEGWVDTCGHTGFIVLDDGEQLDDLVFGGRSGDIGRCDLGDAFDGYVVDADLGVECERRHDGGLVRGVIAFDVTGRVRLGVTLLLRLMQCHVEVEALGGHLVEDVVRGAVDDAQHAVDLVACEGFAQRAHNRDCPADRGFEEDVDAVLPCGLVDFLTVLGKQRLVGGYDRSAGFDGLEHEGACRLDAANQLDDDIGAGAQLRSITGEQGLVDPRVADRVKRGDADDPIVAADAVDQLVMLLNQQTCGLRADGSRAKQRNANGGLIVLYHSGSFP